MGGSTLQVMDSCAKDDDKGGQDTFRSLLTALLWRSKADYRETVTQTRFTFLYQFFNAFEQMFKNNKNKQV